MNISKWLARFNGVDISGWYRPLITSVTYNKARKHYTYSVRVPANVAQDDITVYFQPLTTDSMDTNHGAS